MSKIKALGLFSGGIDSILAAKVLQKQGIEVIGINFFTGFYIPPKGFKQSCNEKTCINLLKESMKVFSERLAIEIVVKDIAIEYIQTALKNPKYGYGSYMNPCIDCKIVMLKNAKIYAKENGIDIIFTGDVVGQRPMTQFPPTLKLIERQAGLENRVLRPLTAKLLPETDYERNGLVNREFLLDIKGRSKKRQLELLEQFQLQDLKTRSAGNCYLLDESYSRKLKDYFKFNKESFNLQEAFLLRYGRHFRISPAIKLIVSRDKIENQFLKLLSKDKLTITTISPCKGPFALLDLVPQKEELLLALSIVARYSKCDDLVSNEVKLKIKFKDNETIYSVKPLPPLQVEKYRI